MDGLHSATRKAIAEGLCRRIGQDRFDLWFSDESILNVVDGDIIVSALDEFSISCIRQHFSQDIRSVVDDVLGVNTAIHYVSRSPEDSQFDQMPLFQDVDIASRPGKRSPKGKTANKPARNQKKSVPTVESQSPQLPPPSVSNEAAPKYEKTLKGFHFGSGNELLQTAVQQVLQFPGRFSPLVIHGPAGCGKSHLLQASVQRARRLKSFRRSLFMTAEQFTSSFVEALGNRNLTVFRRKYRELDLLAIDDLQFFDGKRATLIEFQNTIESLIRSGKQIVIGCDRPLYDLGFLPDELRTRLTCGLVCPMSFPDEASRIKIIRDLAKQREMELAQSVVRLLAEKIPRDVRLLSGALNRLKATMMVNEGQVLTAESAGEALADIIQSQVPILSISHIEKKVCEICGIQASELRSPKRIKRVSTARMLAMWLSRKHTTAALSEIGEHYGGRSHSTVVAAGKKIDQMLRENDEVQLRNSRCGLRSAISRIESDLRVG